MTAHPSRSRTRSAGTDITCLPWPQSYRATNSTDARQEPSVQRSHASCDPGHHTPSSSTSTDLGGSIRRTSELDTIAGPIDERWLPVPGYEGRYEVSDHGRVRSLPRHGVRGSLLVGKTEKGYRSVDLWLDNKPTTWRLNRLVESVFHRPAEPEEVCRHLNGDSLDNRAENLRWGTDAENAADTLRMGRHPSQRKTECKHGHEFTPENTRIYDNAGGRQRACLTCAADRHRAAVERAQRVSCGECGVEVRRSSLSRHRRRAHMLGTVGVR